jgi:catechol 2,3-dioxygenase-like lactoylglutathione lyase family enzyme
MESSTALETRPFTKVDTVIVRVPDLEKAMEWYEEKLGLQPGYVDLEKEKLAIFKTGGETSFTLYELKPGEEKPTGKVPASYPIFYARDINEARRHLELRGVKVGPVQGTPGQTQWFSFWDQDGNLIEACHY